MGRSTDVPGSETVRGTSSRCGALSVSAARPAGLSGSVRNTTGAFFQSADFGSGIDRGTERTAARIIAGSERYRLAIPLHRSAHPPSMGSRHCMSRHCPSPSVLGGHLRVASRRSCLAQLWSARLPKAIAPRDITLLGLPKNRNGRELPEATVTHCVNSAPRQAHSGDGNLSVYGHSFNRCHTGCQHPVVSRRNTRRRRPLATSDIETVRMGVSQPSSVPCVGGGSSGDVGCVVGPVTAGGALPGDGDGDVDAEHAGQDCGGQVGGQLEQRGGAGFPGVQAELSESLGEL